jgi:hypothetical protein
LALSAAQTPDDLGITVVVVSHVALILLAVALWKFPFGVASLLLPKAETQPSLPWSQQQVIETASVLIGLFYMFYAVSDLLYWFSYSVAAGALGDPQTPPLAADQWASIITTVAEVAISFLLIFGASGVARFIHATRYAGKLPSN